MSRPLRIAMIGCGFMGKAHSNAWSQVNHFFPREHKPVLKVAVARPEEREKLEAFQKAWGYEEIDYDWRKAIARKDVDLVDVCVPNNMHHDVVIAAAEAGKIIVCEKPLAMNMDEARAMVAAVEKAKTVKGKPSLIMLDTVKGKAVIVPKSNVQHLMLREEVVDAAAVPGHAAG